MKTRYCPNCGGDEFSIEGGPCRACNGTGKVPAAPARTYSVFLVNDDGVRARVCIQTFVPGVPLPTVIHHACQTLRRFVVLDDAQALVYASHADDREKMLARAAD
jgi:hypothetical protein